MVWPIEAAPEKGKPMFELIAKAFYRTSAAADCADDNATIALRAEVETLFRADMDRFTRIAMGRRARKAAVPMALAA